MNVADTLLDLTSLPFDSVIKARRALKRASDPTTQNAKAGPSMSKERRLAMMKAQLASMQQRKGKAVHVVPTRPGDLGSDEEDSDDEPETESTSKGRREKRNSKHAYVPPPIGEMKLNSSPSAMGTKRQVSRNRQVVEFGKTVSENRIQGVGLTSRTDAIRASHPYQLAGSIRICIHNHTTFCPPCCRTSCPDSNSRLPLL